MDGPLVSALAAFVLYLVSTVAIGLWAARRGRGDEEDYFLAGRRLPALSMALSAVSSGRSAWLVVGASAAAWSLGLSALWLFPGYVAMEAAMFVTVGPRLRERSAAAGAITIPEVLALCTPGGRHPGARRAVRPVAGLVICVFLVTYVSAQLSAGAKTLGGVFPIDGETWGLLITAGIVLVYTILGGYRAVVVTDVLQAVCMLAGLVLLPCLGLAAVGGPAGLARELRAIEPGLVDPLRGGVAAVVGGLAIGLGSLGNPHILVRHMSLRDPREARLALGIGTSWNAVVAAGALLMGLVGRALYPSVEALGPGREYLYATLSQDLSVRYLVPGFVGLLVASLFAAIMSTCDSQLLVIASSFVRDFRATARGAASAAAGAVGGSAFRGGLVASRLAVLGALTAAVAIGYGDVPVVNHLVLLSWGALGIAFGPAVLLLLFDRRTTPRGVLAGVLVGALSVATAWWIWARPAGRAVTWELVPSFAAATLAVLAFRAKKSSDAGNGGRGDA